MAETQLEMTTQDELLEAFVLQNEERLEGLVEAARMRGSGEGPRFPTTLNIGGEVVTIKDRTPEEKERIAVEAVNARSEKYAADTFRFAKVRLGMLNEVEALDFIRALPSDADREIYLRAERAGQARQVIFDAFGNPPDDLEPYEE